MILANRSQSSGVDATKIISSTYTYPRSNSLPSLQISKVGSTEPLEKSWDIRNEDNMSYHARYKLSYFKAKGLGYNTVPPSLTGLFAPPSIDLSNSGLEKFKQPEFEGYGVKVNKGASENVSKEVKKTSDALIIEDWVSDCDEDETVMLKSLNVQKPKQADQPRKVSQNHRNNSTSWNTPMPKKLGVVFQFTPKACFVCGSFNHLFNDY
ncbi:hypothetical protein Tco_0418577 [Tanacetum coccineum]